MSEERFQSIEDTLQEHTQQFQEVKSEIKEVKAEVKELRTEVTGVKAEVTGLRDRVDDLAENQAFFLEHMNQMEARILHHFAMAQEAWRSDMRAFREGCQANKNRTDDHEDRISGLEERAS